MLARSSRRSAAAVLFRITGATGVTSITNSSPLLLQGIQPTVRWLSSHDDFAPQLKASVSDDLQDAKDMIAQHVKENPVMLYMKGTPGQPMCGFSAKVVGVLKEAGTDFSSVNVLDYPAIREGVKQYSEWPTIPQLYVKGEFIGGCDIVVAMHEAGELQELLKEVKE